MSPFGSEIFFYQHEVFRSDFPLQRISGIWYLVEAHWQASSIVVFQVGDSISLDVQSADNLLKLPGEVDSHLSRF